MNRQAIDKIRNFSIIAHVDHGKSTLADALLLETGTLSEKDIYDCYLDNNIVERQRGITIKLQTIQLDWVYDNEQFTLNLIDTPGHCDFTYEVMRSLAVVEGCIWLVDATQGIQSQSISNLELAFKNNLTVIPVLSKIDLVKDSNTVENCKASVSKLLNIHKNNILTVSAKEKINIDQLLDRVVLDIDEPKIVDNNDGLFRASIFNAVYDTYLGVVLYIRVFNGSISRKSKVKLFSKQEHIYTVIDIGIVKSKNKTVDRLTNGNVGYIIIGIKDIKLVDAGDVIMDYRSESLMNISRFIPIKPMIYSSIFPVTQKEYKLLSDSIEKINLNDSSIVREPESSVAFGFGFRCGFLGMLHLDVTLNRIKLEYGLDIISTLPQIKYRVINKDMSEGFIISVDEFKSADIYKIYEPICKVIVIIPSEHIGKVNKLCSERRGRYVSMVHISDLRVKIEYVIPLFEIIANFYDRLKSLTHGYGTCTYDVIGDEESDLIDLNILVNREIVTALSVIIHRSNAVSYGRRVLKYLLDSLDREMYEIPLQASIGSKIIARETVKAYRKDVTAKLYGGDVTRKNKLLEKQKKGKKRLKNMSSHHVIPQDVFIKILSN